MKYAKIIEGEITIAPKNYITQDNVTICNFNSNEEIMAQYGFKRLVEEDKPTIPYNIEYIEHNDYIEEKITINLNTARAEKLEQLTIKANEFEQNGYVEYKNCVFEMSIYNRNNLRDTVEALTAIGQAETEWSDKNDNIVILTVEDLQYIRLNLILGRIRQLWIEECPRIAEQISQAVTENDFNNIDMDFQNMPYTPPYTESEPEIND